MRRLAHIVLTLLALLPLVAAGKGVPTWVSMEHDFGTFAEERETLSCVMRVVNTGDTALVITRVQSTCGCTVASYSHEVMQPGDTGEVKITYSSRHIPGQFEKRVFVYTNGVPARSVLTIRGNVIGRPETVKELYPVSVGPVSLNTALLPLGEMKRGRGLVGYVSGYNTSDDTVRVTTDTLPPYLSAHAVPAVLPPGGLFILSVYFESGPAPLWGLNEDSIRVHATPLHSTAAAGSGTVVVTARVKEDFSKLTPEQLKKAPVAQLSAQKVDFGDAIDASVAVVERTLTLRNTGKSLLEVRRLFIPHGEGVEATCPVTTIKAGKSAEITLRLKPSAMREAMLSTTLNVITNDPYEPQQLVRLVGLKRK